MGDRIDDAALATLFTEARTAQHYHDDPIGEADVRAIYDLMKWGPTASNASPARFVWLLSGQARERLAAHASGGNPDKIRRAPAAVVIGHDLDFNDKLPFLYPAAPGAKDWFGDTREAREPNALRNGSLQSGYFIIAARALGFDVGPMTGFDADAVTTEFFGDTGVRANIIATFGRGDRATLYPRGPRLDFDDANTIF